LGKTRILDIDGVDIVAILNIIADNTDFQWRGNFVWSDNETSMIYMNKVNREIRFGVSERLVEVRDMFARGKYELVSIICTYRDNDLFEW